MIDSDNTIMKNICILGSTGSIGRNTLDIIRQHPGRFKAQVLVSNKNTELLEKQILEFHPDFAIIYNKLAFNEFVAKTKKYDTKILYGYDGLIQALDKHKPNVFVNAFVGFAGLVPTIHAINSKINIALANKETLVVAGSLIMNLAKKMDVSIVPIDSEHSAIWQCLAGEDQNKIRRLILTASGGPFRTKSKDDLTKVTPEEALKHPNWKMGPKITIDSATLMNKGLEVIEAYWLYGVAIGAIDVIIHPQSIIHSMVEFEDKSIKAQLGIPDMRIPIQYALDYPRRHQLNIPPMNFTKFDSLTFELPDLDKFPCLNLAYQALKLGKTYTVVLNAANEIAVEAFLNYQIKYIDIPIIIKTLLDAHIPQNEEDLENLLEIDKRTRQNTFREIKKNFSN
jgi:1-deoxy-D-xylulose-5-phosphate reductoisomerase